jgi:hypothetical protein
MKRDYYIYVYCDPRHKVNLKINTINHEFKNLPIYIGVSKKEARKFFHLKLYKGDKNRIKKNKIKAILNRGLKPIVYKIKTGIGENRAKELEKKLISEIGTLYKIPEIKRGPLTNMTIGGDGGPTYTGRKLSEEHKRNISKGNQNKITSLEARKNMSVGQRRRKITISEEKRKKMIYGLKNLSEKSRQNISRATKNTIWIYNKELKKHKRIPEKLFCFFEEKGWEKKFCQNLNHKK